MLLHVYRVRYIPNHAVLQVYTVCFFLLKTSQRYLSEYENRCTQEIYYATEDGGRAYDTTWVLALALNSTMAMVTNGNINGTGCENMSGSLLPLDQFNYTNQKMGCLIQWNIQRTNFSGVTVSQHVPR